MDTAMCNEASQANPAFGALIIEVLRACGVSHFVVSPGSRSTPLTVAAAESGLITVIPDERSAAFYALGRIKVSRRPVAFICTSGSAPAHALPAVIEAAETALPLIILSADRPPELQHCHAGQTIDQVKLFGEYVRFFAQLPMPQCSDLLARQVREICSRALEAALGFPAGPIHLNCPFREPFFHQGTSWKPKVSIERIAPIQPVCALRMRLDTLPSKTLLLAGPRAGRENPSEWAAIAKFAQRTQLPVLADGCNPFRHADLPDCNVIAHYDRMVRNPALWNDLVPEAVVQWGEPPTSKILRQQLQGLDLPVYHVGSGKPGMNPLHGQYTWLGDDVHACLGDAQVDATQFGEDWARADALTENALQQFRSNEVSFYEGDVHRILGMELIGSYPVIFANSLTIRGAEWFLPKGESGWEPFSQRGANGIDGTVSLARGIVEAAGQAGVLIVGDLALLHDSNGLLDAMRTQEGLLIIAINNQGGGIFELLPAARQVGAFETLFATPQSVDLEALAKVHGMDYFRAEDADSLRSGLSKWKRTGLTLLEVCIDRKISANLHRSSLNIVSEAPLEFFKNHE
jgi:2-succinyl-5-enolpyruvyl-6-hydroxy-3-cyclohexene-1-carboxylate synthase